MALKAILETLDDVPEALRELYTQVEDRFVLDLEEVDNHPGVRNLKSAFEREKEDRRKAREEKKALEERLAEVADLDPGEAREALQKLRLLEEKKLIERRQNREKEWRSEGMDTVLTVDEEVIAEVLSNWTGIPVFKLTEEETAKLQRMERELNKRIVGQDEAVEAVSR
jgi:ATP-dependent Clp protease ATP-binding subunit ClpC